MAATTNRARIHFISNRDLREGRTPEGVEEDPEGIAQLPPGKRAALLSNPQLGPDDEPVQIVATNEGRVVGQYTLFAGTFETPEASLPCYWGSGLFVSESARGLGVATALLEASEALPRVMTSCGVSRQAMPLFVKRGYLDVAMPRHVLVRRTQPVLEHWLGRTAVARAAAATADVATAAQHALLRASGAVVARGLRCEQVDAPPPELDELLAERAAPVATYRSNAWLEWVLREQFEPDPTRRRALYVVRAHGARLVGYFVVKSRVYSDVTEWELEGLDLGSLVDWQIFDERALSFQQLVFLAFDALARWRVGAMEVCVPAHTGPPRLARWGFKRVREQHLVVQADDPSIVARPELRDLRNWLVRPGEGVHAFS
jgi:GNAT superfamily N-acetyltransferase